MSGFLTNVFDQGDDSQSASNSQHAGLSDAADIDQSFSVSDSEEVSFTDFNGTEHSYSNSQDVTVDVGVHAVLGVAADASQGAFVGDGFEE